MLWEPTQHIVLHTRPRIRDGRWQICSRGKSACVILAQAIAVDTYVLLTWLYFSGNSPSFHLWWATWFAGTSAAPKCKCGPTVQPLLRISRWPSQGIKPHTGPFRRGRHPRRWPMKPALLPAILHRVWAEATSSHKAKHVTLRPNHPMSHCPAHTDGFRGERVSQIRAES